MPHNVHASSKVIFTLDLGFKHEKCLSKNHRIVQG